MTDLFQLTQDTIAGLGDTIELVDIERAPKGLLRVTIDTPTGVTIEDCEKVSRQLSRVFEVENIDYQRLEVGSPGLDRPLRHAADFHRFVGERVEIKLHEAVNNQKVFRGVLGTRDDSFALVFEDQKNEPQELLFNLDDVAKAKLDPILDFKGKKR